MKEDSKSELIALKKLKPYKKNSKKHNDEQINLLMKSITEYGFTRPIMVWGKQNQIVAGHGTYEAAKKLDLKEVPVRRLDHLSETQMRAYLIADNRLSEIGTSWDAGILLEELTALGDLDFNIELTGFELDAVTDMILDAAAPKGSGDEGDYVEKEIIGERPHFEDEEEDDEIPPGEVIDPRYTAKITAPIYEIKGEMPHLKELYNPEKMARLSSEIEATADLPPDLKLFLKLASYRHVVFNYEKIAEYYAHASKEVQHLMERSALVIIDFEKAIEEGFVVLSDKIAEAYKNG